MGNCIRKESPTQWGGEDWGSFSSDRDKLIGNSEHADESQSQIGGILSSTVKIKISKKQLEQLLKKADFREMSAEQVLAEMVNGGGGGGDRWEEADRQPWRPSLRSIPE